MIHFFQGCKSVLHPFFVRTPLLMHRLFSGPAQPDSPPKSKNVSQNENLRLFGYQNGKGIVKRDSHKGSGEPCSSPPSFVLSNGERFVQRFVFLIVVIS